jgi:hypothetical protein
MNNDARLQGQFADLHNRITELETWQKSNLRTITRLESTIGNVVDFLKDGETIEDCLKRNRRDMVNAIKSEAKTLKKLESAERMCRDYLQHTDTLEDKLAKVEIELERQPSINLKRAIREALK